MKEIFFYGCLVLGVPFILFILVTYYIVTRIGENYRNRKIEKEKNRKKK